MGYFFKKLTNNLALCRIYPEYKRAIAEIYRVLAPAGRAVLQVPWSILLKEHFNDAGINTDELRLFFFGEECHFHIFSRERFLVDLKDAKFKVNFVLHDDYWTARESVLWGVNPLEGLLLVEK